jgi:hypothetical protein
MRRFIALSFLACIFLTVVGDASAEQFIPKMSVPKTYKDVQYGIQEVRDNIETVQCGGFASSTQATVDGTTVDGDVPIPDISPDLPGRANLDPLGDPKNGLGTRDGFAFPGSTFGYLSACNIFDTQLHDPDLEKLGLDLKMVIDDESDPNSNMWVDVADGTGEIDINPHRWCIRYEKSTPAWCKKLYEWFQMLSSAAPRPASNAFCPCPDNACYCPSGPEKHYCFDSAGTASTAAENTKECHGEECRTKQTSMGGACTPPLMPLFGNKLVECEWGIPQYDADGNFICQNPSWVSNGYDYALMSSYYRHYAGAYKEPGVTVTEFTGSGGLTNIKEWKVRAECYEYYLENDPKTCVTSMGDEQCEIIIATPDEQNPDLPEWIEGGGHQQKENYKPDQGFVAESARDPREAPSPWKTDPETNLSLIGMEMLRELQEHFEEPGDISGVVGAMIEAKQRASMTTPDNARTDMFDDTALRKLSSFWEAQEKELLKMLAQPTAKLAMPAHMLVGLDEHSALLRYAQNVVSKSNGVVELTLRAGSDDLGNILSFFENSAVLPVHEVRIPLLVPLVSEEEISTRIFEWQQWKMHSDRLATMSGQPSVAGMADPLIEKLEKYREAVRRERRMRGALAKELTRVFDAQKKIHEYLARWYRENLDQLERITGQSEDRKRLKWIWRQIQRAMLQADECQLQWCSNQRYSVPIYSLLDEWWGEEPPGGRRDLDYLPRDLRDLDYEQPQDQVYDFSDMKFATGGLLIPVLWPVQVKLNLPIPPLAGVEPPNADQYPDLPVLPDERIFDSFQVPTVTLPAPPVMGLPADQDLGDAIDILREFREIIDGTSIDDQIIQEDAAMADTPLPEDNGPWNDRWSMRGTYCRFTPSIMITPDREERSGNPNKIIHVENDLKERVARFFARWMPERLEDAGGRMARLNDEFPDPDDMTCKEDVICNPLMAEETLTVTWQWFIKTSVSTYQQFIKPLKELTLPTTNEQNPYQDASLEALKRLFIPLDIPLTIDLTVTPPSP